MSKTVCIDFDGVIHSYTSGWTRPDIIPDPPMDGAKDFLMDLKYKYGYIIIIFTTRAVIEEGKEAVWRWLTENGMNECVSYVTNEKPPAIAYIDDRAIRFDRKCGFDGLIDQIKELEK